MCVRLVRSELPLKSAKWHLTDLSERRGCKSFCMSMFIFVLKHVCTTTHTYTHRNRQRHTMAWPKKKKKSSYSTSDGGLHASGKLSRARYPCSARTVWCLLTGNKKAELTTLFLLREADSCCVIHHLNTSCFLGPVSVCDQWLAPVSLPLLNAGSCAAKPTVTQACWRSRGCSMTCFSWLTF